MSPAHVRRVMPLRGTDNGAEAERPYITINVPKPLYREAEELLQEHPELGYRNLSEFGTQAFREWVAEMHRRVYYANISRPRNEDDAGPVEGLRRSGTEVRRTRKSGDVRAKT